MSNEAKLVDASNQCSDETEIDKGDKRRASVPGLPSEKCHDCPYCPENGDYEKSAAKIRISLAPNATRRALWETYRMDAGVIRP